MSVVVEPCSEEPPCGFYENPGKYLRWMIELNVQKMKIDIARNDKQYLVDAHYRWQKVADEMKDLSFMQKKEIADLIACYLDRATCYAKALDCLLNLHGVWHIERSITIAERHLNAVIQKLLHIVQHEPDSETVLSKLLTELFKSFCFVVTYQAWTQQQPELIGLYERLVKLEKEIKLYIGAACKVSGMIHTVTVRKQQMRELKEKREWKQYIQLIEQFKKEIARFMSYAGGSCNTPNAVTLFPQFYRELHALYWHLLIPKCREAYGEQKRDRIKQQRRERYSREKSRKQGT